MPLHHTPDLKPRLLSTWLLALLLFIVVPSRAALQLAVEPEQPSGVFQAAHTVKTQTELLFSLRLRNDADTERAVYLSWKIADAAGKVWLKDDVKLTIGARGAVVRRLLFDAPARGAYVLSVEAKAKLDGPDDRAAIETPFAVVATPDATIRPHSFFALSAPTILSADDLQFYKRIGARVLRSDWMPGQSTPDGGPLTEPALDAQLQIRADNGLTTQAVLPYQTGLNDALWLQSAQAAAQRYRGIESWEASGELPANALDQWTQMMQAARPDAQLFAPLPRGSKTGASSQSWTMALPDETQPSAAIMRLMLTQGERVKTLGGALRVRQDLSGANSDAITLAGQMVARYVMAASAGAQSVSAVIPPPRATGVWSSQRVAAMTQAAAFSHLTARLEDATFSRDVWGHLPTLWASVFKTPTQSIAVVWADTERERGTLKVQWPTKTEARIYDLFGNEIGQLQKGRLFIPLGPTPVYVVSDAGPNETAQAIGKGELEGLPELAARVLPITRLPQDEKNASKTAPLRVLLQNIGIEPQSGALQVSPPRGWKLETAERRFTLKPGEYAIYEFPVVASRPNEDGLYPLQITAAAKRRQKWSQTARTATAVNVRAGEEMRLDGVLSEWSDAAWMRVESENKSAPLKSAQLAMKWSADTLFIAVQVREDKLSPRDEAASEYSFAHSDAIQLAFGTRDEAWMRPARGRFRDTDYGFLLSPFRALPDGSIEARVLRLWSPTVAFGELPDRVRYGGVPAGARCVIRRDKTAGLTIYEAMLPLSLMPELQPALRSADALTAPPLRFGWIAHSESGAPLQWSRATDIFSWWNNTGSFLPADALYGAAQAEMGFTRSGAVGGTPPSFAPPSTPPDGVAPIQPVVPPAPKPTPTPKPTPKPAPPEYTPPMPIDLLPPAAPVEGWPLPPSTP